MKTTAIYPGSFNPLHEGHRDVIRKALRAFDYVMIAQGLNPAKGLNWNDKIPQEEINSFGGRVRYRQFQGLLVDFVKQDFGPVRLAAIVRGIRNGQDLEDEKTQLYWNEDLGLMLPVFHVITDRKLVHISSSAIRAVKGIKKNV